MFINHYKRAFAVLAQKPILLWGLSLLLMLVTYLGTLLSAPLPILSLAIGFLLSLGAVKLYMDGLKGNPVSSKQLFFAFNKNWLKSCTVLGWQALWSLIWAFVPIYGIVKAYSYRFVPYIAVTHPELSAFDALKLSMRMTEGKKGQMFLADLVFAIAPSIATGILTSLAGIRGIGFIFAIASFLVSLAVALFGTLFSGLYQASFFNEDEANYYINAQKAAEAAAAQAAAINAPVAE